MKTIIKSISNQTVIKKCLIITITLLANLLLLGGAIRNDVDEEGYLNLGSQLKYNSVALILDNGKAEASGVLIDNQWVLTAGHEYEAMSSIDSVTILLNGEYFEVKEVVLHPEYTTNGLGHGVDLALIKLKKAVKSVQPATLYRGNDELNHIGTTVGYGVFGTSSSAITNPKPAGTKRAGNNMIDQIGGVIDGRKFPDNFLISDFDSPANSSLNIIGSSDPLSLEYLPLGGDSGGGLFIDINNETFLAGLFSALTPKINDDKKDGLYGSLAYWTRLSNYNKWIDNTISH